MEKDRGIRLVGNVHCVLGVGDSWRRIRNSCLDEGVQPGFDFRR